jgi:hypothetical protein
MTQPTRKEIEEKIRELKDKTFDILSKSYNTKNPFRVISLKSIKLTIEALEYSIGLRKDLDMISNSLKEKKHEQSI